MVLSRKVSSSSCRSSFRNSPGFAVPAFETTRPISRSFVSSASFETKPSCERSRQGAELNTKVPCDIASDLVKQAFSPGHQHDIDPGRRDLSCEFRAYPRRSPCDERPRPELLFINQRLHGSSPFAHLNSSTAPRPVAPSFRLTTR